MDEERIWCVVNYYNGKPNYIWANNLTKEEANEIVAEREEWAKKNQRGLNSEYYAMRRKDVKCFD